MNEISKAEEMVLLAIWRLAEEAYGVAIRRQICRDTGKDYTYGTLYGLLRQMYHKGYIKRIKGAPLPKKGGRSKTYFMLMPLGIKVLQDAIRLHNRLWKGVNEFTFDES
jgi:PadR family transcriptional regulator PadR